MPDLLHNIVALLRMTDPVLKAQKTRDLVKEWQNGAQSLPSVEAAPTPPIEPGRPKNLRLVAPGRVPRRKIGTPEGRIALLHAIAHIELNAINLALDIVARFIHAPVLNIKDQQRFACDWLSVADDEAKHFTMINERLKQLGSSYGVLPVHHGLWEAAMNTRHDLAARLAIAPMLLEARGLDVTPSMIDKLIGVGDKKSAATLKIIYEEEIGHVAKGVYWFNRLCAARNEEPQQRFQDLVRQHLPAGLRPPFNHEARKKAGLTDGYYQNILS